MHGALTKCFLVLLKWFNRSTTKACCVTGYYCDSDGAMEHYVDGQGIESTLPVPAFSEEKPYLMGFFLVGAYQEILGDMHNLFGDTHSAIKNG